MKIEKEKEVFARVTITLETQEEVDALYIVACKVGGSEESPRRFFSGSVAIDGTPEDTSLQGLLKKFTKLTPVNDASASGHITFN